MAKKKSRAELEADLKALRRHQTGSVVAKSLESLFKWAGITLIAYWSYRSIEVLAGETTTADIGLTILADVQTSKGVAWIVAILASGYGLRQRTLRKRNIERLQARIRALESHIDPGRTSSGLTPQGETNPKDS